MTLNEIIDEYHDLSEKRQVEACKNFLKEMLNSDISYFTYTIHEWMISVADAEQDDMFGTEGMDL